MATSTYENLPDTLVPHRWLLRVNSILTRNSEATDNRGVPVLPSAQPAGDDQSGVPRLPRLPKWVVVGWLLASLLTCAVWDLLDGEGQFEIWFYLPALPVAAAAYLLLRERAVWGVVVAFATLSLGCTLITSAFLLAGSNKLSIGQLLAVLGSAVSVTAYVQMLRRNTALERFASGRGLAEWTRRNRANDAWLAETLPLLPRWWGEPGASLSASSFDEDNVRMGQLGERKTARTLGRIVQAHPHAFVLHSVKWPGTAQSDLDHILVAGRNIYVIDSKRWQDDAVYSFTADGQVRRNGWEFDGGRVHLASAVQAVRDALASQGFPGTYRVSGVLAIQARNITLVGQTPPEFVVIAAAELETHLARMCQQSAVTGFIDPLTLLPALQLFLPEGRGAQPWSLAKVAQFSTSSDQRDRGRTDWEQARQDRDRRRAEEEQARQDRERERAEEEQARQDRDRRRAEEERARRDRDRRAGGAAGVRMDEAQARFVLGVDSRATMAEIRQAWKEQCATFHPDKYPEHTEVQRKHMTQKLAQINAAYTFLKSEMAGRDDGTGWARTA